MRIKNIQEIALSIACGLVLGVLTPLHAGNDQMPLYFPDTYKMPEPTNVPEWNRWKGYVTYTRDWSWGKYHNFLGYNTFSTLFSDRINSLFPDFYETLSSEQKSHFPFRTEEEAESGFASWWHRLTPDYQHDVYVYVHAALLR